MLFEHLYEDRSLWSIMRTCRTIYHEGMPAFLGKQVKLSSLTQYATFCEFIRHQPTIRANLLRDVHLYKPPEDIPEKDLSDLVNTLERAKGLKKIGITQFVPYTFKTLGVILLAMEHHTRIQELDIALPDNDALSIIDRWRSPLRRIGVVSRFPADVYNPTSPPINLTWLLKSFPQSVRKIYACNCNITWSGIVFPLVEELWLSNPWPDYMEAVIQSFPNVRIFGFKRNGSPEGPVPRRASRKLQWQSLDRISADLKSIYFCALRCTVNHLDLRIRQRQYKPEFLNALLSEIQANRVDVSIREACWTFNLLHVSGFLRSIMQIVSQRLYHLKIFLEIFQKDLDIRPVVVSLGCCYTAQRSNAHFFPSTPSFANCKGCLP